MLKPIFVLYLVTVLSLLFACGMVGYWIVQPVAKAVQGKQRPTRFSLVDLLWLSILVAGATAPLANLSRLLLDDRFDRISGRIGLLAVAVVCFVWWRGVATLTGLGIADHRRRGAFLVLIMPAALAISAFGVPVFFLTFWSVLQGHNVFWFWFAAIMGFVAVVLLRSVSFWVLATADSQADIRG